MTVLTLTALKPLHRRVTISRLLQFAKFFIVVEKVVIGLAGATALLIIVQLVYPSSRTLPFQQIGSVRAGYMSLSDLEHVAKRYSNHSVTLQVGDASFTVPATTAGIQLDTSALSKQLSAYSWRERLIPGSIFHNVSLAAIPTQIDVKAASSFAQSVISKTHVSAKNAGITRQNDGSYTLDPQITGEALTTPDILRALAKLDPIVHTSTRVVATAQAPSITDDAINAAIRHYDHLRSQSLTLSYNHTTYSISPELLTSWASITIDTTKSTASVTLDQQAIRQWLSTAVPLVLKAPGTSTVTLLNGAPQSRTAAATGTGINLDATVAAISTAVQNSQSSVAATLETLSPKQRFVRQYTPDNTGLQALITDWSHDYRGLRAGVAIQELGGENRHASLNGDTQYKLASMYKMFVTWYAFNRSENGMLDLNSPSPVAGKSYSQCIRDAIVNSDNPCGEGMGDAFGWATLDAYASVRGYTHTTLLNYNTGSPSDMAQLLVNLANGSLMNTADTQTLLGYMGQQIFRSGIPAGSPGAIVQDKVGFDPGVWNDGAIVRGPHASYVLVVYTNGNVDAIKDLASRVYALMER